VSREWAAKMMEPFTVLIVDDVRTNLLVIGQCLKGLYNVREAVSGAQCLKLARSEPQPDLILLDVVMPDLDGYEVCKALKSDPMTAEIPIIFVTGKDTDDDETLGLQLGAVPASLPIFSSNNSVTACSLWRCTISSPAFTTVTSWWKPPGNGWRGWCVIARR
jgi:CheY-like chemotaxis protein